MSARVGEPLVDSEGRWFEIHLVETDQLIAVAFPRTITVTSKSGGIDYCEATIHSTTGSHMVLFSVARLIQVWFCERDADPREIMRGRIDCIEMERQGKEGPHLISIEARNTVSPLVDDGLSAEFVGSVAAAVEAICAPFPVSCDIEDTARIWVNTASAYGALRLLGQNLHASIVVSRIGGLTFRRNADLVKDALKKPRPLLDGDAAEKVSIRKGAPVDRKP